jgi:hypothetical protein
MNQGAGRRVLIKKTACKKSRDTVPLNAGSSEHFLQSSCFFFLHTVLLVIVFALNLVLFSLVIAGVDIKNAAKVLSQAYHIAIVEMETTAPEESTLTEESK